MLKRTIKYKDFNDTDKETVCYFHLSKAELVEMTIDGTYEAQIRRIIETEDANKIIKELKSIIEKSYGVRSDDGERFIKTPELTTEFTQTAAYDALFMELFDADKAAEFFNGILPQDFAKAIADQDKPTGAPPRPLSALPPPPPTVTDL